MKLSTVDLGFPVDSELQSLQVLYTCLHRTFMCVPVCAESDLYYLQYLIKCKFCVHTHYHGYYSGNNSKKRAVQIQYIFKIILTISIFG